MLEIVNNNNNKDRLCKFLGNNDMAILVEVIIVLVTVVDILSWHFSDLKLVKCFSIACENYNLEHCITTKLTHRPTFTSLSIISQRPEPVCLLAVELDACSPLLFLFIVLFKTPATSAMALCTSAQMSSLSPVTSKGGTTTGPGSWAVGTIRQG